MQGTFTVHEPFMNCASEKPRYIRTPASRYCPYTKSRSFNAAALPMCVACNYALA